MRFWAWHFFLETVRAILHYNIVCKIAHHIAINKNCSYFTFMLYNKIIFNMVCTEFNHTSNMHRIAHNRALNNALFQTRLHTILQVFHDWHVLHNCSKYCTRLHILLKIVYYEVHQCQAACFSFLAAACFDCSGCSVHNAAISV